jgi:hypothetical protein
MLKITKTLTAGSILVLGSIQVGCVSDIVAPAGTSKPKALETTFEAGPSGIAVEGEVYGLPYEQPIEQPLSPMDLTHDGHIDSGDLAAFARILAADVTHDGAVSAADEQLMFRSLGMVAPTGTLDAAGLARLAQVRACDFTLDGRVDMGDLAAFAAVYSLRSTGDFNGDGVVDSQDSSALVRHFGHEVAPANLTATICSRNPADITGNGAVDMGDLAAFAEIMRADISGNGAVDLVDISLLVNQLGQRVPALTDAASIARAAAVMAADLTGNGVVDQADLARFAYLESLEGIADLTGDGYINWQDQGEIVRNLNQVSECL